MEAIRRTLIVGGIVGIVVAVTLAIVIDTAFAQGTTEAQKKVAEITAVNANYYMAVVMGAALAAGFGFIGGGYAVARVGAAALGASSERPELLTRSLVFVALGEGIAIFGLVVAILLVLRLPA
jgi:V/A-type H+-transporting ATPase subunit K